MKTKLLSKIMLVALIAVMIAGLFNKLSAQNKSIQTETKSNKIGTKVLIPECDVCSPKDDHIIEVEKALRLIADFHNVIVTKNSRINNSGGYFTEIVPTGFTQEKSLLSFPTFKIHWAVENIENSLTRLFIMVDPSNRVCSDLNVYSGIAGLECENMMSTYSQNDIPLFTTRGTKLTTTKILFELQENRRRIDPNFNHFRNIRNVSLPPASTEAQNLLNAFKTDSDVKQFYYCDDLVFEKALSLDQISRYPDGQKSFFYLFGYDKEMTNHPLRLILAGYDSQNRIIFYDATGISLLRQNSRPRP